MKNSRKHWFLLILTEILWVEGALQSVKAYVLLILKVIYSDTINAKLSLKSCFHSALGSDGLSCFMFILDSIF